MAVKILQVVSDNDRRGAQVFALDLERELAGNHDITTVALRPGTADASLAVRPLAASRWSLSGQLVLRRLAHKADVVVAHGSSTAAATTMTLGRTRTPVVYRQISDSLAWADTPLRRLRVKTYLGQMAHIVALWSGSADVLTRHFGVSRPKISIVPNGVAGSRFPQADRRRPEGSPVRPVRVVYLGAMTREKGVDHLVRLARRCPEVEVTAVGDGPELARLRAEAPSNLRLPGTSADPAPVLAAADIFVFPSRWGDSMPAAIIEAAYTGLPAVVTDVGAARELVIDGRTGMVVTAGDDDALIGAVRRLVGDSALRSTMGAAAHQHALAYDVSAVAKRWDDVLRRVVGDRYGQRPHNRL